MTVAADTGKRHGVTGVSRLDYLWRITVMIANECIDSHIIRFGGQPATLSGLRVSQSV